METIGIVSAALQLVRLVGQVQLVATRLQQTSHDLQLGRLVGQVQLLATQLQQTFHETQRTRRGDGSLIVFDTSDRAPKHLPTQDLALGRDWPQYRQAGKSETEMKAEIGSKDFETSKTKRRYGLEALMISGAAGGSAMIVLFELLHRTSSIRETEKGLSIVDLALDPLVQHLQSYPQHTIARILGHPGSLITGIALTSTSLSIYYHSHRGERHQDALLLGLAGTSVFLGFWSGISAMVVVLNLAPCCAIAALLISTYCFGASGIGEPSHVFAGDKAEA